jgi:YqjK-like protein
MSQSMRARRAQLIERADSQREDLARQMRVWLSPLRAVEHGVGAYQGIRRGLLRSIQRGGMPIIGLGAGVGMAALAFVRPERISGFVRDATEFWRTLTEKKKGEARAAQPAATAEPHRIPDRVLVK